MPDPKQLKVGDRIRFISRPEEWKAEGYYICPVDVAFMDALILRGRPSRIAKIDEYGSPWVNVVLVGANGREYHSWAITEETGWCLVKD